MKKLSLKTYQKLVFLILMLGLSTSAMATDYTGIATWLLGFPSSLFGVCVVGIFAYENAKNPTRKKKILGLIIAIPILLFNLLFILSDFIQYYGKEISRLSTTLSKINLSLIFSIYPILICLLGYFIYRLSSDSSRKE